MESSANQAIMSITVVAATRTSTKVYSCGIVALRPTQAPVWVLGFCIYPNLY